MRPLDTEAVIGQSTYFDCASDVNKNPINWYHYRVGAKDHEDICIYCLGKIHRRYESRFEILKNKSIGLFRLIIKVVHADDAGRYVCQDNGGIGDSSSAQLVVLGKAKITLL